MGIVMALMQISKKQLGLFYLGLPIGFPLVPFLNGILYRLVYNRKDAKNNS